MSFGFPVPLVGCSSIQGPWRPFFVTSSSPLFFFLLRTISLESKFHCQPHSSVVRARVLDCPLFNTSPPDPHIPIVRSTLLTLISFHISNGSRETPVRPNFFFNASPLSSSHRRVLWCTPAVLLVYSSSAVLYSRWSAGFNASSWCPSFRPPCFFFAFKSIAGDP